MKLRYFVFAAFGFAVVTFVAAFVVISALVSAESATIDSLKRNQAIYHELTRINFLLLKETPSDIMATIDITSRHVAKLHTDAGVEGDYVLTHRLSELAEAVSAWRELRANEVPEIVQKMIVTQVKQHVLESLTASVNILGRAGSRLSEINRALEILTVLFMFVMVGLATATGWVLRWQIILPLQAFTERVTGFQPGHGSLPRVKTRVQEFRDLDSAFRDMNQRLDVAFQEIEEREAKYSSLFYNSAYGVITLGEESRISAANTAAYEMLGCNEAELLGAEISDFLTDTEPGNMAVSANSPVREGTMQRFDGTAFPAEFTRNAFATKREAQMAVLVFRDISDRKQAEEERQRLEAQLLHAEKMTTVGTLASGMAHDLNNILTPIISYAELLLEDDMTKGGEAAAYATGIAKAGHRAADLVKQILTFSRQAKPNARTVALAPMVEEILRLTRSTAPANIEIVTYIDKRCPPTFIDPTQIHQVLMNLCVNAVHAMGKTGGVLTVSLETVPGSAVAAEVRTKQHEGEYLRISVTDTGHGIDEETRKRIFDPFFTTKEQGEGTGLGLSTAHGIVMAHGGELTVLSNPGTGTAFHLYLPVREAVPSALDVNKAPFRGHGERILVIDDERAITDVVGRMLQRMGYHATLLNDGAKALEVFTSSPDAFDLVITDHLMPKMTGNVLAEKLLEARADLPIILMTGVIDTESTDILNRIGIQRLLLKPVTKDNLGDAIRSVLDLGAS